MPPPMRAWPSGTVTSAVNGVRAKRGGRGGAAREAREARASRRVRGMAVLGWGWRVMVAGNPPFAQAGEPHPCLPALMYHERGMSGGQAMNATSQDALSADIH